MGLGKEVSDWMKEFLATDEAEWVVDLEDGFDWWPTERRQSVRFTELAPTSDGEDRCRLSISTDVVREVEYSGAMAEELNWMSPECSLSGFYFVTEEGKIRMSANALITVSTCQALTTIFAMAASLQTKEAALASRRLVGAIGVTEDSSPHPTLGLRRDPSAVVHMLEENIIPMGADSSPDSGTYAAYFSNINDHLEEIGCSLLTSFSAGGLTTEFPWGKSESSLTRLFPSRHPLLGNGVQVEQQFLIVLSSPEVYLKSMLVLNLDELSRLPKGQGFGAYSKGPEGPVIKWSSFIPMAFIGDEGSREVSELRNGVIVQSLVDRARRMSEMFTNQYWDENSFDPRRSATGRMMEVFGDDKEAHIEFLVQMMKERMEKEGRDN